MTNPIESNKISFAAFSEFLVNPIVDLAEIEEDEKFPFKTLLPHWRRWNLVPFVPAGKKIRLSLSSFVWFKLLTIMREFGASVEQMQGVTDYFFKDAYNDGLPERNLKYNKQVLEKKRTAGTITKAEIEMLERIGDILRDDIQLRVLRFKINYLTNILDHFVVSKVEHQILIFSDGTVGEFNGNEYFSHRKQEIDPLRPHIRISLKDLVKDIISHEDLSEVVVPELLNHNEMKVLELMKTKNIAEIIITGLDKKKIRIESRRNGLLTGEQAQIIRDVLSLGNYEDIILKSVDESSLSFSRTRKK